LAGGKIVEILFRGTPVGIFGCRFVRCILPSIVLGVAIGCSNAAKPNPATTTDSSATTAAPAQPPPANSPVRRPPTAKPPPPPPPKPGVIHPTQHRYERHTDTAAAAAPQPDEYALGETVQAWKNSLKTGAVEYRVPMAMVAGQASTVTVVLHGFQDTKTTTMPDATGTGTLKVSTRMKAELLAPLNPGEFTIAPLSGDPIQFIPNDGFATWIWNVTPSNKAANQQLQIRVSLVYDSPSGQIQQIIEERTYSVSVNVQKLSTTVAQSFWKDPVAWFKYMLPGGAGWAAIAAFISFIGGLGWWTGKKRKKKSHKHPVDA
jgi:hypothetical protein